MNQMRTDKKYSQGQEKSEGEVENLIHQRKELHLQNKLTPEGIKVQGSCQYNPFGFSKILM